jgi:Zn-dependent protease
MTSVGFKIGRVRGIDLRVHISLVLLMAYIIFAVWAQFRGVAAEADIDVTTLSFGPTAWGVVIALGLFVSVVLHELGHAFVAQAMGVRVRSITLMMLGGVAAMDRIPERPFAEFRLSIVGPLVSFALGLLLLAIGTRAVSPDLQFFGYWLGNANLVLGVFNLLPAFPLDGGRALRSLVAARSGHVRATQISVRVSRVLAVALGILGLLTFNIILLLIAFFIYAAAQSELFQVVSRGLLKGMTVGEIAIRATPVNERESIARAAAQMIEERSPVLPVAGGPDAGARVVQLQRIRRVPRDYWETTLVKDVMEEAAETLDAQGSLSEAVALLGAAPAGILPVREAGHIVGIARFGDLRDLLQLRSLQEPSRRARDGHDHDDGFGRAA